MHRNDVRAGRTHESMSKGRGNASAGTAPSPCAPNCGWDYSKGEAAPTLYNPNHNYSPFGN